MQITLMYSIYDHYQYGTCGFMIIQLLSNNIARYIVLFAQIAHKLLRDETLQQLTIYSMNTSFCRFLRYNFYSQQTYRRGTHKNV